VITIALPDGPPVQRIDVKLGGLVPKDATTITLRHLAVTPAAAEAAAASDGLAAVRGFVESSGLVLPPGAQALMDQIGRQVRHGQPH